MNNYKRSSADARPRGRERSPLGYDAGRGAQADDGSSALSRNRGRSEGLALAIAVWPGPAFDSHD
jgi:hypothetical protein